MEFPKNTRASVTVRVEVDSTSYSTNDFVRVVREESCEASEEAVDATIARLTEQVTQGAMEQTGDIDWPEPDDDEKED